MTDKNQFYKPLLLLTTLFGMLCTVTANAPERIFWSYDSSNGMADNSAQTIKCTKTGRIVISTIGHINFYDGLSFTHINPTKENAFTLSRYKGHYHLYFDRYHHMWLKDKNQVTCVDLLTERFISDVQKVIDDFGIKHPVEDMFIDDSGEPWFLSGNKLYGRDEQIVIPVRTEAELHDVDIYLDRQLLLFYGDGVVKAFNLHDGKPLFDIPMSDEQEASSYAASSVITHCGNGFLQIRNGKEEAMLRQLDVKTRRWTTLMKQPYHLNNMAIHKNKIYIASVYGYWTHDLRTGEQTHCKLLKLSRGRTLETDINTIEFDRQGGMWIGTEKRGLLYAKPYPAPFHAYSWTDPKAFELYNTLHNKLGTIKEYHRPVNCIYQDSRGWTWTGTYSGLLLQKTAADKGTMLTHKDGLSNEMIHAVVEDDNHDIWASTSYGIAHLFIKNDSVVRIESYIHSDDVPNETFVNGCAVKLDDGTIVMQALDHMVTFHPDTFHPDFLDIVLYPKLVRMTFGASEVHAGDTINGHVILDKSITRVAEFSVNYNMNSFQLVFSGLNYQRSIQTYWRVRIKGIEQFNDWRVLNYYNSGRLVDQRGMLHLPLSGLKPGTYEIELQASFSPNRWPQSPYIWRINVEEPWWRTSGLYMTLAAILLILFVTNVVLYNRNTRMSIMRLNEERDIVRRIRNFAERCNRLSTETLAPLPDSESAGSVSSMSSDFLNVMVRIVPFVKEKGETPFTMSELSAATGIEDLKLYDLIGAQLEKNPQQVALRIRLIEAEKLLRKTSMTVDEIAEQCHFISTNYFIASFYHCYRSTPLDYRKSSSR